MSKRKLSTLCWDCARAAAPTPYRCVWAETLERYPEGCNVQKCEIANSFAANFGVGSGVTSRLFVVSCPEFVSDYDESFRAEIKAYRIKHNKSEKQSNALHENARIGGKIGLRFN